MTENILVTRALTKKYGKVAAVEDANLTLEKGQIYGLIGRNGAGKTTIIRMVTAQTPPTGGEVELFGATSAADLNKMRARTGAMVEIPSFYPYFTARQNLEYYRRQRGIAGKGCVDEALELVSLADTGKKIFKNFSLGMKQRLGLGLALMDHPEFLLLDEPINGLDPEGIVEFRNILLQLNRDRQTTILISSHILTELSSLATHYGFIDKGHMIEQISADALAEKCRSCLQITVDDAPKAATTLETVLGLHDYEVLPNNVLRLYEHLDRPQIVTGTLAAAGVALLGIENKKMNLEDYFMTLIGGGVHA